ncbi:ketoacyl-ACP synthase III family protein [Pendulispora brunnea]|uniref:Ketoacyl-ACP synthase III family protein n=1 Tax=Pendulispora brunnea TaxID=2905690 RepID=A0ABZ2KHY0_9BACT
MRPESLFVSGIAAYLPPIFSAAEAAERGWYDADSFRADGWTGIAVESELSPAEMGLRASQGALARWGGTPEEIDVHFHATLLPQGPHLWHAHNYIERNAVKRGVPGIELRQGCTGMLAAFDLAACYLAMPGRRAALLSGADNFSADPCFGIDPTFRWRYAEGGRTNRGSVFGDSGAALVLSNRAGFARVLSIVSGALSELEELYRGDDPLFPPSYSAEHPLRLGERFAEYERKHPGGVAAALHRLKEMRTTMGRAALAEARIAPEQITRVVHIFSGTERYVQQLLEPLGIDPARGVLELGRGLGHLGVNDTVVALEHLVTTEQVGPGDHVMMMANGTAGAVSCVVLRIEERPRWVA